MMCNSKMPKLILRVVCMLLAVIFLVSNFSLLALADEPEDAVVEDESGDAAAPGEEEAEAKGDDSSGNIVSADGVTNKKDELSMEELRDVEIEGFERTGKYSDYLELWSEYNKELEPIVIDPLSYVSSTEANSTSTVTKEAEYEGEQNVLLIKRESKVEDYDDGTEDNTEKKETPVEFVYKVNVPENGLYNIEFTYFSIEDTITRDYEFAVYVENEIFKNDETLKQYNKVPFSATESLTLKRNWTDESDNAVYDGGVKYEDGKYVKNGKEVDLDDYNQLLPTQIIKPKWLTTDFYDPNGNYNEALLYYLPAGENTITVRSISGSLAISEIRLHNDGENISYKDYIKLHDAEGAKDAKEYFFQEAEDYVDKSDSILQNVYDRSDPKVSPYNISKTRLNTFGGTNWNTSLQRVNYEIDVPSDGYYELTFRYRQSFMRGTTVYRKLYIDDVVPFKEAEALPFEYGSGYQVVKSPYKVYLTKGKHTLSLQAVIGDMAQVSRDVETAVYQLNFIYRKIIMITGTSPDTYRDYELFENVENLEAMFVQISDTLKAIKKNVDEVATNKGGESEILTTLAVQIDSFIKKPYTIPTRLSTFKDNISSLGSWMINIRDIPLQLDKIIFSGEGVDTPSYKAGFFEKAAHEVNAFISSFVDDYASVGGSTAEGDRSITAWVGTGRDQAIALKTLVDNDFTGRQHPEIGVNVSLVPLSVLSKAIVAGRGPDVALHISRTEPLNLGFRDAFVDLTLFEDYEEVVATRYTEYAMTPYILTTDSDLKDKDGNDPVVYKKEYKYDDNGKLVSAENTDTVFSETYGNVVDADNDGERDFKAYGLPETQNFSMMFYRKDVFDELNITVPNTWDEFDQILPIIQENNMTVGIESAISNNIFFTFIMQNGGQIYNDECSATMFTEEYAVEAFTKWTDYYTLYDFPLSYSWYTRFRNGEMPLVFESYSNITYLAESAPELAGLWGVAPIPGTVTTDSTGKEVINRTEGSVGLSACSIVEDNKDDKLTQREQDAWTFIKWWTDAPTMAEYGTKIEMAIGPVARYTTANVKAFEELNWTAEEAAAIKEQRNHVREIPELVGGYYVSRSIVNAFRNVTNNYTNPREMLFYYNDQINDEIWRKRIEYGLSVPEEAKK